MTRRKKKNQSKGSLRPLESFEIAALNRSFYASDPGDYLSRRIQHLLRLASQTDAELRRDEQEHVFGKVTMTVPSTADNPADEDAHKRLVLVETEMLLHHTAETLLRMFFVHAAEPQVPWIELDRLRGPGQFKRELEARFRPSKATRLQSDIAYVFLGSREPPGGLNADDKAERFDAIERIADYLRFFSEVLLTRAKTYNAAKHGLAVQAGEPMIKIADIKELSAEGPAISHLDKNKREGGGREWVVATRWIQLEQDLSFAFLGTQFIKALWLVARMRYVKWPQPEEGVFVPSVSVQELLNAGHDPESSQSIITEISFPPAMHSPPGSGVDSLIRELEDAPVD